ncbi:1037_t:CDS:1 [Paraglomus occultum]|uniref:1037_t:CDS:1 n=1 Tax=Paraglomus occultum TaxID=144539 RepID=A0A9N9AWD9_9GLOM|nr:1037_t:CDS:1 [Paraglomus occultum]
MPGSWGNNISNNVYESILNFKEEYRGDDRNDIQSIHQVLNGIGNEDNIITIIEKYGFIPFPPSPISKTFVFKHPTEYENEYEYEFPQNGFATVSELKIVAKAIITYPNLLDVWKKIGYHEITKDLENPVVQLTLLNLYSTGVASVQLVAEKLCDLKLFGFPLIDALIGNAILLFEHKLIDVGESLIEGFATARKLSKTNILDICLTELLDPARALEQYDALDYVINSVSDPEQQILSAFEKYKILKDENDPSQSHAFLKYSLTVYRYMLRFGATSPVVKYLMREILIVHTQLADTEDADKLRDADNILDEYYAANVPFDRSLFPLFKECLRTKPISYLFEGYLAHLFGFEIQSQTFLISNIPEVGALMSPTQTEELKQLWLKDIQQCFKSEELVNNEFRKQIIEFIALYNLSQSSVDYYEQLY